MLTTGPQQPHKHGIFKHTSSSNFPFCCNIDVIVETDEASLKDDKGTITFLFKILFIDDRSFGDDVIFTWIKPFGLDFHSIAA